VFHAIVLTWVPYEWAITSEDHALPFSRYTRNRRFAANASRSIVSTAPRCSERRIPGSSGRLQIAETSELRLELQSDLVRRSVALLRDDHFGEVVDPVHHFLPFLVLVLLLDGRFLPRAIVFVA